MEMRWTRSELEIGREPDLASQLLPDRNLFDRQRGRDGRAAQHALRVRGPMCETAHVELQHIPPFEEDQQHRIDDRIMRAEGPIASDETLLDLCISGEDAGAAFLADAVVRGRVVAEARRMEIECHCPGQH